MKGLFVTYMLESEEKRDAFYAEIARRDVRGKCEAEDGCYAYRYFLPCGEPTELCLFELWEGPDAQAKHRQQPHFIALGELKREFGAETRIERFDVSREG